MPVAYLPDLLTHLPRPRVLEIGSRHVTAEPWTPPSSWEHVGLDAVAGPGVDVVGDAHALSSLLPPACFDAVYSHAVLEHLALPWRVVLEMNHVLVEGGLAWIVTHEAFPVHEWPSDFWRLGPGCWSSLFGPGTGFEILGERPLEPARVVPDAPGIPSFDGHLGTEVQVRKTGPLADGMRWDALPADVLPPGHGYPVGARRWVQRARRLLRRLADRTVTERRERSPVDPFGLARRGGSWHVAAAQRARRPAFEHVVEIGLRGSGSTASARPGLDLLPAGSVERLALLGVLDRERCPWALAEAIHRVLVPGGVVFVDTVHSAPADQHGWRLSSEGLLALFHPVAGFTVERRAMLDPCRVVRRDDRAPTTERAFLRTVGLARRTGDFDASRLSWTDPTPAGAPRS